MSIENKEEDVELKERLHNFERLLHGEGINGLIYKKILKTSNKYDKDKITKAIASKDVDLLRKASRYFYYKSGIYRRLVDYFANMYLMLYKITPKNGDKVKDKKFKMFHELVFDYTESVGIENFTDMAKVAITEGVFFGYQRKTDDKYTVQQLPTDYCRTIGKYPSGNYVVEFNLRFFNEFKFADDSVDKIAMVRMYPRDIVSAWAEYTTKGRDSSWYQIPEEFGMCFQVDEIGMPPLVGIFAELMELENYKQLQKIKTALDLVKIVIQKIPLQKDNNGVIDVAFEIEDSQAIHNNLISMLKNNNNIDGYTTPFDVDVLNLQDSKDSTDTNTVLKAEKTLFDEAMTSSNLGNAEGNVALTNSIKNDASWMWDLVKQYQRWVNNYINTFIADSKNYKFEFEVLPITWYNQSEWQDAYSKGATVGLSKMEYAISLGIKQATLRSKLIYERDYLEIDTLCVPMKTSYTQSGDEVGAQEKSESDLTSAGITTRETGSNDNRE